MPLARSRLFTLSDDTCSCAFASPVARTSGDINDRLTLGGGDAMHATRRALRRNRSLSLRARVFALGTLLSVTASLVGISGFGRSSAEGSTTFASSKSIIDVLSKLPVHVVPAGIPHASS